MSTGIASAEPADALAHPPGHLAVGEAGTHDFDFLVGRWHVRHRRLRSRLTHSSEWDVFVGTCTAWPLLNGRANVDDNVLQLPAGPYRAVTIRAFDPLAKTWAIWWLDGRSPHHMDPPVVGSFAGGVGTFYGADEWAGRPIVVRFLWSKLTDDSAHWEQAFSDDGGRTWETNWTMEFSRASGADAGGAAPLRESAAESER